MYKPITIQGMDNDLVLLVSEGSVLVVLLVSKEKDVKC